jgi:hypothetical protein
MQVERKWCDGLSKTTSSTSFTQPATFGRRHHSPTYSIFYDSLWGLHPNGIFFKSLKWESQNWDFCCLKTLDIRIFLKSSFFWDHARALYYSQKDISNGVSHVPIKNHLTLALRGFLVENQILNLVLDPSFDHNSCILGLNEQCKGTLGIYTSKPFQWYIGGPIWCLFTFPTKVLNIQDSHTSAIPKMGVPLGVIGLHPLHSPPFVKKCVSHSNTFSWPHGPLHSTLCHKPNVKVTTIMMNMFKLWWLIIMNFFWHFIYFHSINYFKQIKVPYALGIP